MTFLVERLADLKRHLEHLRAIRPRVRNAAQLETDLSLHNDVLFSLLVICQAVIDIAGELAGRRAIRFQDYPSRSRASGTWSSTSTWRSTTRACWKRWRTWNPSSNSFRR